MTRERWLWLLRFVVLVVLIAFIVAAVAGCAEQSQEQFVGVDGGSRVAPVSAKEVRLAKEALAGMDKAPPGRVNAIVLEENEKGGDWWRVWTEDGVKVLEQCWNGNYAGIAPLIAPGDAIQYSTKGDDLRVCDDEVFVVDLAVTEEETSE